MRLQIAYVSSRRDRLKSPAAHELVQDYIARSGRFVPTLLQPFRSEEELLTASRPTGRPAPYLVLLDSRGRNLSSEQFAEVLRGLRDGASGDVLLAIGPPDGWSSTAHASARLLLSLGSMTLPHELALVILAEQTYRALTILAGFPYHGGHT